ncbi:hypothetical protein ACFXDE_16395 [Kitasatospora sp. NPDC059408]|uniref:hypothetical protein n=1 Tax=Kitasatospora sp. NPDC059408 TaxID=3346823 RepID=UPI0036913D91
MAESLLSRLTAEMRAQAEEACAELRNATEAAGCPLPSLTVDTPSIVTGRVLVHLGGALPEVISRLAEVLRAGADALAAKDPSARETDSDDPAFCTAHLSPELPPTGAAK